MGRDAQGWAGQKACLIFQRNEGGGKLFVMPNKLLGSQNYPPTHFDLPILNQKLEFIFLTGTPKLGPF